MSFCLLTRAPSGTRRLEPRYAKTSPTLRDIITACRVHGVEETNFNSRGLERLGK